MGRYSFLSHNGRLAQVGRWALNGIVFSGSVLLSISQWPTSTGGSVGVKWNSFQWVGTPFYLTMADSHELDDVGRLTHATKSKRYPAVFTAG